MALEDDELYQAAQLNQNYNSRLNYLFNGSNFDFLNRQGKDLLDGTDPTDAVTLQQVQALFNSLQKQINTLNMASLQGTIPKGYLVQPAAHLNLSSQVDGDYSILNYNGPGLYIAFKEVINSWNAGTFKLKYSIDGQPFTNLNCVTGASALPSDCRPYSNIATGGDFTMFFYTFFTSNLQVYVNSTGANGSTDSIDFYVGYATRIG